VVIVVAEHSGFCFGVKRALDLVAEARRQSDAPIATLGELIHNPQVVAQLRQSGVSVISRPAELERGTIVLSAHGVSPELRDQAADRGLDVLDATCPFVERAQALVRRLRDESYQVLILGDRGHRVVIGLLGYAGPGAVVVEGLEDIAGLNLGPRVGLVVQTTQEVGQLQAVAGELASRCRELRVFNTICGATTQRQESARELARRADLLIVVGGRNSANTSRLRAIGEEVGVETHHVETADELEAAWFAGRTVVGVTAGASTPSELTDAVVARIRDLAPDEP